MHQVFFTKRLYLWSMVVFLFFSSQGCSTKYVVESSNYPEYQGEINQHSRLIRTERGRVFQVLTDEEAFSALSPDGTIVTYETPAPYEVGTIVKTRIEHIVKLSWHSRVQEVVQDRRIRLQFMDGLFAGGTEIWELDTTGECTRVTHTIIVQPEGFLRKLAWNVKVRGKHDRMTEAFLDNMKSALETP
jgi:carbon monoxide dehydrogenase subunit G